MKKYVSLLSVFLFLLSAVVIADAGSLEVDMVCPTSVAAGSPLFADIKLINYDCQRRVDLDRAVVGVGGNSGGSLGAAGIWGPFNRNIGSVSVPKATCDQWGQVVKPGRKSIDALNIVNSVPAGLAGTVAGTFIEFMTQKGQSIAGGACAVEVTP